MAARSKRPTRFLGIVAMLAGGGMLGITAVMAFQGIRAIWFHSVQGTVISKKLDSVVAGKINLHTPVIEYSYVAQGKPYKNDVFNLVDSDGTEQWARSILGDFPVGAACTVYYDPLNPQTSALSTRPTSRAMWLMIGSAFFGLVLLLRGIFVVRANGLKSPTYGRGVFKMEKLTSPRDR